MKFLITAMISLSLLSVTGCMGGGTEGSVLLGQMPDGYDMYVTFNPEAIDMTGILENLKDVLPEDVLEEAGNSGIEIDLFNWQDWKSGMALRDGEIGIFALGEENDLIAFMLPCTDQAKLERFVEENDLDDAEYFPAGDYIVMVTNWGDDDLLDDLEEALNGQTLSSDEEFSAMEEATPLNDACITFFATSEIAEVPVYGAFSSDNNESVLKVTVTLNDDDAPEYMLMAGNGLQSNSIVFPENTLAAVRFTLDMDMVAEQFESIAEESDGSGLSEVEAGLPFIGFSTMEEFLSVFQGDICVAVQNVEIDEYGDPENIDGVFAISLADAEKLGSSLSAVSVLAEADRDEIDGVVTYRIENNDDDFWYFISDDVFYVTMNIDPEDVMNGSSAADYFQGFASEGFFGGAVDPRGILEGIEAEDDVREIITTMFEDRAVFSVSIDGRMITSTAVAGPDILKSFVSLAPVFAEYGGGIPEPDLGKH